MYQIDEQGINRFIMQPKTIIAKRLKEAMEQRGVNTAELARDAGVKKTFLYDVLSGKSLHPSTITLAKVAAELKLPLAYFTGANVAPSPSRAGKAPFVSIASLSKTGEDREYYYFRRSWIKEQLDATPENLRLMFIQGGSMVPTLEAGDQVLVNTADTIPSPEGLFALKEGETFIAKRLERVAGKTAKLRVLSDNPKYRPYETAASDLTIVGRIVWMARSL